MSRLNSRLLVALLAASIFTLPAHSQAIDETDDIASLREEIASLREVIQSMREELAAAKLDAEQAKRELDDLKQFIADHHQYGNDFEQYQAIRALKEREAKQKEVDEARERREAAKEERIARRQAAREELARRKAEAEKVAKYRRAGFAPVGLDVYASKMAFAYETEDIERTRFEYDPYLGRFLRVPTTETKIDFSKMTFSGSILNASEEVRNLGVAVTFFDDKGNQVGHEIIHISNARPDVPYPFTSTIEMALNNRAFNSSSTYVLYADAVESTLENN